MYVLRGVVVARARQLKAWSETSREVDTWGGGGGRCYLYACVDSFFTLADQPQGKPSTTTKSLSLLDVSQSQRYPSVQLTRDFSDDVEIYAACASLWCHTPRHLPDVYLT